MRLELVPSAGSVQRPQIARWVLERGRRMIGRAADCDWQLPDDQRSVSKLHCIIERKGNDFTLEDKSANGSLVDGKLLRDGAAATLRHGSRVELGGLSFEVVISGTPAFEQADADAGLVASSESLTVSSILADIVPAGQLATGILGPREIEDPLFLSGRTKPNPMSSRNVQIGWNGPPTPETISKVIPEDWYSDGDTELGHSLEHSRAPRVAVHVASRSGSDGSDLSTERDPVSYEEWIAPNADADGVPPQTEQLLHQLELALEQGFELLGVKRGLAEDGPLFTRGAAQAPADRMSSLLAKQLQLNASLERLLRNSARTFDPTIIEARVDGFHKKHIGWLREAAYWRAYRAQFEQEGRRLSAADLLLKGNSAGEKDALEEGKKLNEV